MSKMSEKPVKSKILKLIFLASLILPLILMTGNPVYDEFWTLQNFVPLDPGKILTDLSLPNNHPLNTLFLKIFLPLSDQLLILRLHSLISGAFIPVLCGELAWRWSKKNQLIALISASLLAMLSVPLIIFSGLARGYAMQMCFLLLCVWGLTQVKEKPVRAIILSIIGGIGTFLSVPNGALFLVPVGIGYLLFSFSKECRNRSILIAVVIAAVAGIFYGINFNALRSAQVWGEKIRSFGGFLEFFKRTMKALVLIPPCLLTIPAWCGSWKRAAALLLSFIPVLLAVFSNAGPERCYLYFSAVLAVAGGIGIAEISERIPEKKRLIAAVIVTLVSAGSSWLIQYDFWKIQDYIAVFEKNFQEMPPEIFPVYRASSGYPVRCGVAERDLQEFNYRIFSGSFNSIAFFECASGEFNGLDHKGSETTISTAEKSESGEYGNLPCRIYSLTAVEKIIPGKEYLLLFSSKDGSSRIFSERGEMLYLNPWLFNAGQAVLFRSTGELSELPEGMKIYCIGESK